MKRIRILHTADIHLDASFASLGVSAHIGNQLRAAQRRVFSSIVGRARDWPADLVVISGDLFDSLQAQGDTVAFVADALEHLAPIPVYIAPGNRDPYTENSPWATVLWPENVTIFTPGKWQECSHPTQEVCIHGIGCDGSDDSGSWFNDLRIEADGRLHIAVAHGTEKNHQPPNGKIFAPFDAAAIAQDTLAYLALGHFHDPVEVQGDFPTAIHYPGSSQGRSFQELDDRSFLEVHIEETASGEVSVRVTPVSCADITFESYTCPVGTGKDPEGDLDKIIEGDSARQVAHLKVTGTLASPAYQYMESLRNHAKNRFLHAEIVDVVERTAITPTLAGMRSCLSRFNETLAERIADAADQDTVLFEAYARDLAITASRSQTLPNHDAEEVLS